ILL
ncbi:hypothetical protein S40288_10434, partial [Stachybotrys chartarum IBT 40288]